MLDPAGAATRLVALKGAYPSADLAKILMERPLLLTRDPSALAADASHVRALLSAARDVDALVTALPLLTDPRVCVQVLVTVEKWYFGRRPAIEVLEADPDLIRRAEVRRVLFLGPEGGGMNRWGGREEGESEDRGRWARAWARQQAKNPKAPPAVAANTQTEHANNTHALKQTNTKACDVPLEPVYLDPETGAYRAPSLNYKEKRADWQRYIDQTFYKQE